jgi:hypothetical protein
MTTGQDSRLHAIHTEFHCVGFVMNVSSVLRWLSARKSTLKISCMSPTLHNTHRPAKEAAAEPWAPCHGIPRHYHLTALCVRDHSPMTMTKLLRASTLTTHR